MPTNFEMWMAGEDRGPCDIPTSEVAVIVVDMQNWFCKDLDHVERGPGREIENFKGAIPGCVALVEAARKAGHPVIFTRYVHLDGNADVLPPRGRRAGQEVAASFLAKDTYDIEVIDELAPGEGDFVIDKSRPSSFYGTRLEPLLAARGIRSLVVCGVTTNICVETTVRDAHQRGFDTYVVEDATAEFEWSRHWHALYTMEWSFGTVVKVADVERSWSMETAPVEPAEAIA
ncbi:cysteine hydrolase family protein [Demequina silvatica]|uniref:cysteine hydrolase family protein n=1 Tax=Demequina silvatica TaxID=1638988 RepID=UPI000786332C|nr:cysteine hydrolase [Demequina silvatica]